VVHGDTDETSVTQNRVASPIKLDEMQWLPLAAVGKIAHCYADFFVSDGNSITFPRLLQTFELPFFRKISGM
jgi:hypothetical protein